MRWASEPAALVYVGVAEKMEATSAELKLQLKLGCDDVTDNDGEDVESRPQAAVGGVATLTRPAIRLKRGSGHRPSLQAEPDDSKVKRPL